MPHVCATVEPPVHPSRDCSEESALATVEIGGSRLRGCGELVTRATGTGEAAGPGLRIGTVEAATGEERSGWTG
jgi:hypothetical protein